MAIEVADSMPDGWQRWLDWQRVVAPDNAVEIKALESDRGNHLGYVRLVARRRVEAKLSEQIVSVPAQYTKKPLLRGKEDYRADPRAPANRRPARQRVSRKPRKLN